MTIHWTLCWGKIIALHQWRLLIGAWILLYTAYILQWGAITNYSVFDCQSADFVNKTGESEYAQEMVEISF